MRAAGLGGLSLAAVAVALASPANATVGGVDPRPDFSAMPEVALPAALDAGAAPERIPPGEVAEGLVVPAKQPLDSSVTVSGQAKSCVKAGFFRAADGASPAADGQEQGFVSGRRVLPVRAERLVIAPAGGAAALEILDGWVDPQTGGARLERRTRVELVTLARGPAAFSVYGFRSGGVVAVVIPRASHLLYVDPDGEVRSSQCGHARLELGAAAGEASTIFGAALLDVPAPSDRPGTVATRRAVQLSASMSRASRDPSPVLSVTVAWVGEELQATVRRPPPALELRED